MQSSVLECLLSLCKTLGSITSTWGGGNKKYTAKPCLSVLLHLWMAVDDSVSIHFSFDLKLYQNFHLQFMLCVDNDNHHYHGRKSYLASVRYALFLYQMPLSFIETVETGIISAVSKVGRRPRLKNITPVT